MALIQILRLAGAVAATLVLCSCCSVSPRTTGSTGAVTLETVSAMLTDGGVKHRLDSERECILTVYGTRSYMDRNGEQAVLLVIELSPDNDILEIFAPGCYSCPKGKGALALIHATAAVNWHTRAAHWEYDHRDGELRAVADIPVDETAVTVKQLKHGLKAVVYLVDKCDPLIRSLIAAAEAQTDDAEPLGPARNRKPGKSRNSPSPQVQTMRL